MICTHLLCCRGGKRAIDDGDVDTCLLKNCCRGSRGKGCGKDAGYAITSSVWTVPVIAEERRRLGVELLKCGYDSILKILHIFCELSPHGRHGDVVLIYNEPRGRTTRRHTARRSRLSINPQPQPLHPPFQTFFCVLSCLTHDFVE